MRENTAPLPNLQRWQKIRFSLSKKPTKLGPFKFHFSKGNDKKIEGSSHLKGWWVPITNQTSPDVFEQSAQYGGGHAKILTMIFLLALPSLPCQLSIIPVVFYPKKVDCGCKIHECYTFSPLSLEILLNTKVKYYESGITNILSLREAKNKFPLISFAFYFCHIYTSQVDQLFNYSFLGGCTPYLLFFL